MRTLWWVEGAGVFGKAVADGWCFHMEGECWLSDTPCRRSKLHRNNLKLKSEGVHKTVR